MLDFRPPKDSPGLITLAQLFLPQILHWRMGNVQIAICGDGLSRFRQLDGKRVVVCPNHSNRRDPEVMFALAAYAKQSFNYIAAREVFDWNNGMNGWFLQRLGTYSVVRGAIDRESFKTTKRLLVEGHKKLVLFPEGEISKQNDVLLPLESGACQLSFMALDELHKMQPAEPIFILPVALKYTYKTDISAKLQQCVEKLAERLGLKLEPETGLYEAVRQCALSLLAILEEEYNHIPNPAASLTERIDGLRAHILRSVAEYLDIELPPSPRQLEWVRILRNALDDYIYDEIDNWPEYKRKIHEEKATRIRMFYRDLNRVVNFIAIYDGYLTPPSTQERLANVIELMEIEIFGDVSNKGPRLVWIDVGTPINLLDSYTAYRQNKKAIIENVSSQISIQLHDMLEALDRNRNPVYVT